MTSMLKAPYWVFRRGSAKVGALTNMRLSAANGTAKNGDEMNWRNRNPRPHPTTRAARSGGHANSSSGDTIITMTIWRIIWAEAR